MCCLLGTRVVRPASCRLRRNSKRAELLLVADRQESEGQAIDYAEKHNQAGKMRVKGIQARKKVVKVFQLPHL